MTIYPDRRTRGGGSGAIYPSDNRINAQVSSSDPAIINSNGTPVLADGITAAEVIDLLRIENDGRLIVGETRPTVREDDTALRVGDLWVDTSDTTNITLNSYTGTTYESISADADLSNYLTSSQIENFAKVGDTTRVPESKIDTVLPRNADVLVRVNEAGNQLLPSSRVGTLVEALGLFGIGAQLYVQNDEPADSDAPAGQTEIPAGSIWISGAGSLRPEIRIANRISGLGWEFPDVGEIDFDQLPTNADTENSCLLYTSPSPRDRQKSRMPSSA